MLRIGVASTPDAISGSIVRELAVEVGDDVAAGALLATTDTTPPLAARAREAGAELRLRESAARAAAARAESACVTARVAAKEAERRAQLVEQGVISAEESEAARGRADESAAACRSAEAEVELARSAVELAKAARERAESELERSRVRAPAAGRVLAIHAQPGELVGGEGLLELGRVDAMYAIAEVFESEIGRVKVGQRATVTSEALGQPMTGVVTRIRPLVRKQDVVGTDPAADKDARIVEVEVRLDDPARAAALTHLQVDIVLQTGN